MKVWWAFLPERCVYEHSLRVAMEIAYKLGRLSCIQPELQFQPIWAGYGRTDLTRQGLCETFYNQSKDPDDVLVMFDIDHQHPTDILQTLVRHKLPIVVPLMFRRGEPYQACAFRRGADGELYHIGPDFSPGVHEVQAVGSGVIAIQRGVFETLLAAGHRWWWKYEYLEDPNRGPSEDLYFSKICEATGIKMYVDCSVETPHLHIGYINRQTFARFNADNPGEAGVLVGL